MNSKSLLLLTIFSIWAFAINAQFVNNSSALSGGGGYSLLKFKGSTGFVGGANLNASFDAAFGYSNRITAGVNVDYLRYEGIYTGREVYYAITPLGMKLKYFWGSEKSNVFVHGLVGFHTSRLVYEDTMSEAHEFGMALGTGLGFNQYLSDNFYLSLLYDVKWLGNTNFETGITNTFGIGMGYHFRMKTP